MKIYFEYFIIEKKSVQNHYKIEIFGLLKDVLNFNSENISIHEISFNSGKSHNNELHWVKYHTKLLNLHY